MRRKRIILLLICISLISISIFIYALNNNFSLLYKLNSNVESSNKIDINKAKVICGKCSRTSIYTGNPIKPSILVRYNGSSYGSGKKLVEGVDYNIKYYNNKNVGTAKIEITGTGNFIGKREESFDIVPADISNINSIKNNNIDNQKYTGRQIRPRVILKHYGKMMVENRDYILMYSNNISIGNAAITVTGKGNYTGTRKITFSISYDNSNTIQKDNEGENNNVYFGTVEVEKQVYTGKKLKPSMVVKDKAGNILKKGRDYIVKYSNNIYPGKGKLKIIGKGDYIGSKIVSFTIEDKYLKIYNAPILQLEEKYALSEFKNITLGVNDIEGIKSIKLNESSSRGENIKDETFDYKNDSVIILDTGQYNLDRSTIRDITSLFYYSATDRAGNNTHSRFAITSKKDGNISFNNAPVIKDIYSSKKNNKIIVHFVIKDSNGLSKVQYKKTGEEYKYKVMKLKDNKQKEVVLDIPLSEMHKKNNYYYIYINAVDNSSSKLYTTKRVRFKLR